jgi:hypothetical protein
MAPPKDAIANLTICRKPKIIIRLTAIPMNKQTGPIRTRNHPTMKNTIYQQAVLRN